MLELLGFMATGIFASLVATQLSLGQFHRGRVWEKKLGAYTAVLNALYHMKRDFAESVEADTQYREMSDAQKKKLQRRYQLVNDELRQAAGVGDLLFSPEAVGVLNQLFARLDRASETDIHFYYLESGLDAVDTCLEGIRAIAKRDLSIRHSNWSASEAASEALEKLGKAWRIGVQHAMNVFLQVREDLVRARKGG